MRKYETVNVIGSEVYSRELEKLVNSGYHVISAGATNDTSYQCFRWWAIAEKNDEPQQVQPTQQATDERTADVAELLEAKRKISRMCHARTSCMGCCFHDGHFCSIGTVPANWDD